MAAGRYDLLIERGATFTRTFTWKTSTPADPTACSPKDLTGYTAKLQIRETVSSPDPALVDLTEVSGIVLGGVAGTIAVTITAAQTTTLGAAITSGVWDLELTSGSVVTRLLEGAVEVRPDVTR